MKPTPLSSLTPQTQSRSRPSASSALATAITPVDDYPSTSQVFPEQGRTLKDSANTSYLMYEAVNDEAETPIRPELQTMKREIDAALVNKASLPPLFVERMEIMQELYETLVTIPEDALLDLDAIEEEKQNLLNWLETTKERQTFAKVLQESLPTFVTAQELEKIGFTEIKNSEILDPSGQVGLIKGFSKPNTKGELDYVLLLDPLWIEPNEHLPIGLFSENRDVVSKLPIDIKTGPNRGAVKAIILAETATRHAVEVMNANGAIHDLYQINNRGHVPPPRVQPPRPQPPRPQPPRPQPPRPQPPRPQPPRPQPSQSQPSQSQPPRPQPSQSQPSQSQPPRPQPSQPRYNQQQQTHTANMRQQFQKAQQQKDTLKQEMQRLQRIKEAEQSRLRNVRPGIPVRENPGPSTSSRSTPQPTAPQPSRPVPPPPPVKTYQQMRSVLKDASNIQQVRTHINLPRGQNLTLPQKPTIPPSRNQDEYRAQNVQLLQHVERTQQFSVRCNQVAQVAMREKANLDRIRKSVALPTKTDFSRQAVFFKKDPISWSATRPKGTGLTYQVYHRNNINWNQIRTSGREKFIGKTNSEAAKAGFPPQLPDESFATLHHIGQKNIGSLVESSTRYHGVGKPGQDTLHYQFGRCKPHPTLPIDRPKFDVDQRQYWKDRIAQIESE